MIMNDDGAISGLGSRRTRIVDDAEKSKHSSHDNSNERNVIVRGTSTDPIINVVQSSMTNFRHINGESKNFENSTNLSDLTEEFNDLTRKMNGLKEALKNPSTGSRKKLGPASTTNSSSQAVQVLTNLHDVLAAKRFIHDCIVELTFIDHFLDGNGELTANYREKLHDAMTRESAKGRSVVIHGSSIAPNTFELVSPERHFVADLGVGTSGDLSKHHRKEAKVQTDVISMKISGSSIGFEPADKANVRSNQSDPKKKRKG